MEAPKQRGMTLSHHPSGPRSAPYYGEPNLDPSALACIQRWPLLLFLLLAPVGVVLLPTAGAQEAPARVGEVPAYVNILVPGPPTPGDGDQIDWISIARHPAVLDWRGDYWPGEYWNCPQHEQPEIGAACSEAVAMPPGVIYVGWGTAHRSLEFVGGVLAVSLRPGELVTIDVQKGSVTRGPAEASHPISVGDSRESTPLVGLRDLLEHVEQAKTECTTRGGMWIRDRPTSSVGALQGCKLPVGENFVREGAWFGLDQQTEPSILIAGQFASGEFQDEWTVSGLDSSGAAEALVSIRFNRGKPIGPYLCRDVVEGAFADLPAAPSLGDWAKLGLLFRRFRVDDLASRGVPTGPWRRWVHYEIDKGEVRALGGEVEFLNGSPVGTWRLFDHSGTVRELVEFGLEQGSWKRFDPNGTIFAQGPVGLDGRREGVWTYLSSGGQPLARGPFNLDRLGGDWTFWTVDGEFRAEGAVWSGHAEWRWGTDVPHDDPLLILEEFVEQRSLPSDGFEEFRPGLTGACLEGWLAQAADVMFEDVVAPVPHSEGAVAEAPSTPSSALDGPVADDPKERRSTRALPELGHQSDLPPALRSRDANERQDGLVDLERDPRATAAIVWVMRNDSDAEVRRKAWRVMRARLRRGTGDLAEHEAAALWILETAGSVERVEAIGALGDASRDLDLVGSFLDDHDARIRRAAVDAVLEVGERVRVGAQARKLLRLRAKKETVKSVYRYIKRRLD